MAHSVFTPLRAGWGEGLGLAREVVVFALALEMKRREHPPLTPALSPEGRGRKQLRVHE